MKVRQREEEGNALEDIFASVLARRIVTKMPCCYRDRWARPVYNAAKVKEMKQFVNNRK